jgi:hypothetical protein
MTHLPDLTAEILSTSIGKPRAARADATLGARLAATAEQTAPPAAQVYRPSPAAPARPELDAGPRSFPTVEAKPRRERPGLTEGMRARLLSMIAQCRAASAEAQAHGARRQELIQDLVKAQQQLRDYESQQARVAWLNRGTTDPAAEKELEVRRGRVTRLQAGLAAASDRQNEAAQRCGRLKDICGKVGAGHALAKGQAVWGHVGELVDIETLEGRLLEI